jgi:hypothetical protein
MSASLPQPDDEARPDAFQLVAAGRRLVAAAAEQSVTLRLLGGAGVMLHCERTLAGVPHREIGDLDVIVPGSDGRGVGAVFESEGYEPDRRFNAMQGDRRMIFNGPSGKVDVFVDSFEMCHRLELSSRLTLEPETIPAADLLLTKLQVVELTQKDLDDIALLLTEHELASGPGDHIDVGYMSALMGDDWGLWRTSSQTLQEVAGRRPQLVAKANELSAAFEAAPKTRRFRMRARVGERKRWYDIPDET